MATLSAASTIEHDPTEHDPTSTKEYDEPVSSPRGKTLGVLALVLVVVVAAGVVTVVLRNNSAEGRARSTVEAYLADWSAGRYEDMAAIAEQPVEPFSAFYRSSAESLRQKEASYELESVQTGDAPGATFRAGISFDGYPDWTYTGTLPLVRRGDDWRIAWTRAALHPAVPTGGRLALVGGPQQFGHVLDRDGEQIAATDPQLTQTVIGRAPGESTGAGPAALHVALADTLDGRAPATVQALDAAGRTVAELTSLPGTPGRDVPTTLDLDLQKTAEQVAGGAGKPTSIVLLDTRNGDIVAAAGNAAAGPRPALTGRFPPGSTFKIVTATAALQNGFTLDTPVSCPPTASVDGVTFRNAEDEAFGEISLRTAFAKSCNTAFVDIAEKLPEGALAVAAEFYGCTALPGGATTPDPLPIPTFTCNFPPATGAAYVAAGFGQAQVETSPLGMASIAAAASTGTWHAPRILPPDGPLQPTAEPRTLPDGVADQLRTAMQAVVSSGTATTISGSGVAGKTGTAEFGTETPPRTHAWFTGYQGNYAVAVLVQDGGFGGEVAAPLAARMLNAAQSG